MSTESGTETDRNMKLPFFKKADIALAAVIIAACVISIFAVRGSGDTGRQALVRVDGETVDTLPLSMDQSIVVETRYGSNKITVKGGEVFVEEADCSSLDCVHMGRISRAGQMIVCLPHHLLITVTGAEDAPDAIVR